MKASWCVTRGRRCVSHQILCLFTKVPDVCMDAFNFDHLATLHTHTHTHTHTHSHTHTLTLTHALTHPQGTQTPRWCRSCSSLALARPWTTRASTGTRHSARRGCGGGQTSSPCLKRKLPKDTRRRITMSFKSKCELTELDGSELSILVIIAFRIRFDLGSVHLWICRGFANTFADGGQCISCDIILSSRT